MKIIVALIIAGVTAATTWFAFDKKPSPNSAELFDPSVEAVAASVERLLADAGLSPGHIESGVEEARGGAGKKWRFRDRAYRVDDAELMRVVLSLAELEEANTIHVENKNTPRAHLVTIRVGDMDAWRLRFVGSAHEGGRPKKTARKKKSKYLITIIIDDIGSEWRYTPRLIALNSAFTFSVLPNYSHTEEARKALRKRGREIMLHIPMEPKRRSKRRMLGKGALWMRMDLPLLRETLIKDLSAVPEAKGANNHMGSRFTAWEPGMNIVLDELKKRKLFFVDSRTGSHTKAYEMARKMGMKCYVRDVFLDHRNASRYVRRQWYQLLEIARYKGKALAIAHPRKATYYVLRREIRRLGRDYKLAPASAIVE